jgi:transposase
VLETATYSELQAQLLLLNAKILEQQQGFVLEKKKYFDELKQKDFQIEFLSKQIILLKKFKYGRSSEGVDWSQLGFFNEAEALVAQNASETASPSAAKTKRGIPKRRPIPECIPRRQVIIELSDQDRQCPSDGTQLHEIGREVSEKLNIIPATVEVVQTIRIKYGCRACDSFVKAAPVPEHILPKSLADVGLLALIVVSKFVDALPLYRIEKILSRIGVDIARCTMASWVIELGNKFVILTNLLRDHLLSSDYICADETRILVLDNRSNSPPLKNSKSTANQDNPKNGQMWVYTRSGPEPIVLFDYQPGRGKQDAAGMLEGFKGYLQVDGLGSYDSFCGEGKATRLGCWAHVRRKFFDAWIVLKKPQAGLALEALEWIAKLYAIESEVRGQSSEQRFKLRLEKTKPLLAEIRTWLDEALIKCLPKGETGQALSYMDRQWSTLVVFLENGRLEPDNNFTENKIRPFAVGRKNWLFAATTSGAESASVLYSLIETARANGLDSYDYMHWLMLNFPKANTIDDFENLLPHNAKKLMKKSDSLQPVLG